MAEALKLNPTVPKLGIYSACSKLATRKKIARLGEDPKSMVYATHEHAEAWSRRAANAR